MFNLNNSRSIPLKVLVMLIIVFAFVSLSSGQEIKYKDSWGPAGFTYSRANTSGMEINFSLTSVFLNDEVVDGVQMKTVGIPGVFLPNDAGMPDLAGAGRFIAIPTGATVSWRIVSSRIEKIQNIEIAPAPVLPLDNDPRPLVRQKNMEVYSKNAYYPESPVRISDRMNIRGVDAIILGITPFQYNPVTKELVIYRDLKVELTFMGGNGQFGDVSYRSRWFEPILQDVFLNYESLPKVNFDNINVESLTGYEYVIIRPNSADHAAWADSLKRFRTEQGIKTTVVSLSEIGGNTVEAIKNWVTNAYNTWQIKPTAVCLLGDYGSDANTQITSMMRTHPASYPNFPSDNYYADVNNDEMPEIVFSRIVASTTADLQKLVGKQLYYERFPVTQANYYNNPITALGWQTERWFQLCSEIVGGFWRKVYSKLPLRVNAIYSGTPGTQWSTATNTAQVVAYFGPAGRYYIPLTPDSLGGWSGGTAAMVNNGINSGAFMLQHRDHGLYTGWGEPSYSNSNVDQLTNANKMTFVYSINCQTGAYQYSSGDCLVERFIRHMYNGQYAGAVGAVAPSEVSYSFVNDTYCWGMYDNMWPNFMPDTMISNIPQRGLKPAFGAAAGRYFLMYSNWPYNTGDKLVTYRLYHMFGDAFLTLYSEVPQTLSVNIPSAILAGQTSVSITATAGAFVALTLNGEILGTATATGSSQNITIPGTQVPGQVIKVVATKQNYFRWEGSINVIPASGPYVTYHSHTINDAPPLGNGNGLMDYGETNKLNLRVKNVGSAAATNTTVKLTTTDSYITITDSTENYGNINAGDSVLVNNAFTYNVANNIPDNRNVSFTLTITSGSNTWVSNFTIIAHAPVLKYGGFVINDSIGNNNGRWDPGETVKVRVTAKNNGSSQVANVVGTLTENDPYITIVTGTANYGNIAGGDSVKKEFTVSSASNTPSGYAGKLYINLAGNLGISTNDTINVIIGQNVFYIGNGTQSCGYPFYTYYMDSRTTMLYTAAEINAGDNPPPNGYITHIGFNVTSAASQAMEGFKIFMQNTTASTLTGFMTGGTLVYSGTYTVPGTGWQDIQLQTPFLWTGNNLAIEICFNNSSWTSNSTVNGTVNSLGQLKHNHSDLSTGDGCTQITSPSSSYTDRPNIKLTFNFATGTEPKNNNIPTRYELSQNYPNPFNPVTKINYAIPKQGLVTLKIYDILGREVLTLVNEVQEAGYYSFDFDASSLASGVYFYKLTSGTFSDVKRMVLIK